MFTVLQGTLLSATHGEQNRLLCVIFWAFPRRLIIECRRFGTLYLFHLQRLGMKCEVWKPLKMEQIKCSETSAFNNQTQGKCPKDYTQ